MGWNKAARNFVLAPDSNWTLIWHCLLSSSETFVCLLRRRSKGSLPKKLFVLGIVLNYGGSRVLNCHLHILLYFIICGCVKVYLYDIQWCVHWRTWIKIESLQYGIAMHWYVLHVNYQYQTYLGFPLLDQTQCSRQSCVYTFCICSSLR